MSEPHTTRRYRAFLSYRHADNAQEGRRWAEWLHRSLERYVVPPDLVGKLNQRGEPIPESLYPIFRDEDELPADADLATGIRRALERSDCMIVLCSPRSAQSPWVRQEVREFKELGRSDRILAVILAGEPNADDPIKARDGVFREEECFPVELRTGVAVLEERNAAGHPRIDWTARTEPLAADLRPHGHRAEGFTSAAAYKEHLKFHSSFPPEKIDELAAHYGEQLEHARLKIIAGILGIPLSQLVDRDALHRAKQAEQEAQRQKEIADRERALAGEARLASERLRKRNRVLAVASVMVCVLAVAAVVGFAFASINQRKADEARQKAINAGTLVERKNTEYRAMLVEAARSDRLVAEEKLHAGREQEAFAHLARAGEYDPTSTLAAEKAAAALNTWQHPLPSTILSGHEDSVRSAQFSPDGTRIATASDDNTARVWDAATGQPLATLAGHGSYVRSAQFSPDGKRLVTASYDETMVRGAGRGHDQKFRINHGEESPVGLGLLLLEYGGGGQFAQSQIRRRGF